MTQATVTQAPVTQAQAPEPYQQTQTGLAVSAPIPWRMLHEEAQAGAQLVAFAESLQITNAEQLEQANTILKQAVRVKDAFTAEQKKGIGPLQETINLIRGWFRPPLDACTKVEEILKLKIANFTLAQQKVRTETFQAAAAAHVAGDHNATAALLSTAQAMPEKAPQGTNVKEVWHARITAANIVPYDWCVPDLKRINAHARNTPADRDPTPIPGVIFEKVPQVAVRRK